MEKLFFVGCNSAAMIVNAGRLLLLSAILPVEGFGKVSAVVSVLGLASITSFGVLSGLNRHLPIAVGNHLSKRVISLSTSAITFQLFTLVVGGMALLMAIHVFGDFGLISFKLAGCLLFLVLATSIFQFSGTRILSYQKQAEYSLLNLCISIASMLFAATSAQYWGAEGALVGMALSYLIIIPFPGLLGCARLQINRFSISDVVELIKVGLPVMIAGFLISFWGTLDRLFLISEAHAEEMARYHLGVYPIIIGLMIGSFLNQFVGSKTYFRLGKGESLDRLSSGLLFTAGSIASFLLLAAYPIFIAIRFSIISYLTEYESSLEIIKITLVGGAFSAANISFIILVAAGFHRFVMYLAFVYTALAIGIYAWITHRPFTLTDIAMVSTGLQIVWFLIVFFIAGLIQHGFLKSRK